MGCGLPGSGGDDDDDDDFTQVPQVISVAEYITPNDHCTTRGAKAKAANGITYTCKTLSYNNQLRWRP